ncbi:hypothetical protein KAFR_0B00240 [Kazachstania africana CBS 2517]|uniref:DNA-directed RNA polymerase III subunit RPC3 n=1 Tax=Kazachstania africana (strain ATCC 22294 / BCRC 22015 / CBS 2517 / CECT 1963 / NBRC 1671 / NRRL Y-8276) TaxID=1071382 RepID=H2APM4_KAZAF|nr:hypothetical protein KAFR_0B00240 [Kazachstania africana CBS 2517]CCF56324.1 hypothetical protein KAFR_0B00240 [Kazachstania africana CBS 2517]
MDAILSSSSNNTNDAQNGGERPNDTASAAVKQDPVDIMNVSSIEQRTLNPERFLYIELVKSHMGQKAAQIIDVLIGLGRLSARQICEKLSSTSFDVKTVKTTLVSLIQLRCVRYLEETALNGKKTTYYYYNEDGLSLLLYSGLIIEEINQLFPSDGTENISASHIVQNILTFGSITLDSYLQNSDSDTSKHHTASIFVKLCETGFLIPISKLQYTPINEIWNILYQKNYNLIPRNSTLSELKKKTEAKSKTKSEFSNILNSINDLSKIIIIDPETSLKTVIGNIPLTFNLERFLKSRRSKQLAQFAKSRIGKTSSIIYKTALRMTEQVSPPLINPLTYTDLLQDQDETAAMFTDLELLEEKTPGLSFNAIDIAKYLPSDVDLRGSLVSKKTGKRANNVNNNANPSKKMKTEDGFAIPALPKHLLDAAEEIGDGDDHDLDDDYDDDDPHSVGLINSHLKLLVSSGLKFLKETKPGVYYVPYSSLMPSLRSSVYDYIIASTLGQSAMRIRRCICANKLVSEKVINSTALMKEKDIRAAISSLIRYNVVEIQEVPRTVDRSAARAVFLFRSKESHSYMFIKQNLAWNMGNLLFKKEKLNEENSTLLTKANRDDVKGREAELLLASELNQLKMVNERQLTSFTRLTRLISLWEAFKYNN